MTSFVKTKIWGFSILKFDNNVCTGAWSWTFDLWTQGRLTHPNLAVKHLFCRLGQDAFNKVRDGSDGMQTIIQILQHEIWNKVSSVDF